MPATGQHDESNAAGGRAVGDTDWAAVTGSPSFRSLVAAKVVGSLNVGYVLILATYAMAWIVSVVYVRVAGRSFDPKTEAAIAALDAEQDRP